MITGHRVRFTALALASLLSCLAPGAAGAQVKAFAVLIVPFDASGLAPDDQWMGDAVAQVLSRGLAEHPAFVQIDRPRLGTVIDPSAWDEATMRAVAPHADVALSGRIDRKDGDLVIQPRSMDVKRGQSRSLPAMTFADGAFATGIASLPVAYARTFGVTLTASDISRMEKASRLTPALQALKLFTQGQMAATRGTHEDAVDLIARAIEADPGFVFAHYALGTVHSVIGNRWKSAAQYRAAVQLDSRMPEPFKALGDLYISVPRQLFDQAIEAYAKAIDLRPFYSDAYAGLGDAYARKGLCAESANAYRRAVELNPWSTRPLEPCTPSRP